MRKQDIKVGERYVYHYAGRRTYWGSPSVVIVVGEPVKLSSSPVWSWPVSPESNTEITRYAESRQLVETVESYQERVREMDKAREDAAARAAARAEAAAKDTAELRPVLERAGIEPWRIASLAESRTVVFTAVELVAIAKEMQP